MTMLISAALVFTLFYLVGVASVVLPALPGVPVVAVGALLAAWMTGFDALSWTTVVITTVLALLAWLLDYLAAVLGAQRYGSSRAGLWGSIIGSVVGIFFSAVRLYPGRASRRGARRTLCRSPLDRGVPGGRRRVCGDARGHRRQGRHPHQHRVCRVPAVFLSLY